MEIEILIGLTLGTMTIAVCKRFGFLSNALFPPVLVGTIAAFYVVFAGMFGHFRQVETEAIIALLFIGFTASVGHRRGVKVLAIALILHGAYDILKAVGYSEPIGPLWWPVFCAAYDFTVASILGIHVLYGSEARRI